MNTKVEELERLHKLYVAGAITETEFKILKKEIIGKVADVIVDDVYKSVKIGEQEWMVENLNVEHFRNGDVIPEAKTDEEWNKANDEKRPAWCYYDNNISYGEKYGKLYNFYAVSDSRVLAPKGWHIPTDAEWTVLTDYLEANGHRGKALKATSGWTYCKDYYHYDELCRPKGTDDYGWKGLPGGDRSGDGFNVDGIGIYGCWWSSSEDGENWAKKRDLIYRYESFGDGSANKIFGYSVRCLRD